MNKSTVRQPVNECEGVGERVWVKSGWLFRFGQEWFDGGLIQGQV